MKKIIQEIIQTYENHLFSFNPNLQSHFAKRMWRITGEKKYLSPILIAFQLETIKIAQYLYLLEEGETPYQLGKQMLEEANFRHSLRGYKKEAMYQKNPELFFWVKIIHYLFQVKSYGFENILKDLYLSALRNLSKIDLKSFFLNPSAIKFDPSEITNTVYYLQFLKIADFTAEFKRHLVKFWQNQRIEEDWLYKSKIYAFTHLIIAATYFYQKFVSEKDFKEILNFFEKNIEEIVKRTNADMVAEVGLCFRLAKKKNSVMRKIEAYLLTQYEPKLGYIPNENKRLSSAEHRNIIAILCLSDYQKLYPGPNLIQFIGQKKIFYVPKKGGFDVYK